MKTNTKTTTKIKGTNNANAAVARKQSPVSRDPIGAFTAAQALSPAPCQNLQSLNATAAAAGDDDTEALAKNTVAALLSPSVGAGLAALGLTHKFKSFPPDHPLNLKGISSYFKAQAETAANGDLRSLQQMLAVQARTLDHVFTHFLLLAGSATNFDRQEQCMRLAMKAQAQSRNTVESLATIQMGPAIFAGQANINQGGQQQINNGLAPPASAMATGQGSGVTTDKTFRPPLPPRARAKPNLANRTIGGATRG